MNRKYILPLFLIFQIIALQILKFFPEFVENFYSNAVYQKIAGFSRISFGGIGFSIGDCIYGISILFIIRWFWKVKKSWKKSWQNNFM